MLCCCQLDVTSVGVHRTCVHATGARRGALNSFPSADADAVTPSMRELRWLLSAPLVLNSFILLYGASFTLTITVWQAFSAAGYDTVKAGVKALRVDAFSSPAA